MIHTFLGTRDSCVHDSKPKATEGIAGGDRQNVHRRCQASFREEKHAN